MSFPIIKGLKWKIKCYNKNIVYIHIASCLFLVLCSIGLSNHTREHEGSTVHFYDFGLDGKDRIREPRNKSQNSWTMRKFSTLFMDLDGKNGEVK